MTRAGMAAFLHLFGMRRAGTDPARLASLGTFSGRYAGFAIALQEEDAVITRAQGGRRRAWNGRINDSIFMVAMRLY
ncbi:protein of unknown function [Rhodovastum atsumiense]|nr:protein of unknown function [Rhodovastum atsumiense]